MRDFNTDSHGSKRRKRGREEQEKERAIASRGKKVPGLNRATEDIQAVENNVYGQVQNISNQLQKLKQDGIGGDVGTQILRFLEEAGVRVVELTNQGCSEIENSGGTFKGREEMTNYRENVRGRVLITLRGSMGKYCLKRINEFEDEFAVEIREGCLQLKGEIEDI